MGLLELKQRELTDISQTYGTVYETLIGEVSYTKLVNPEGFVLVAKDDQLRFYLYKKKVDKGTPVWEHVWGASSIVHDGLPTSEELIQWRIRHALNAGKQGLEDGNSIAQAALKEASGDGTELHGIAENLLLGKEINLMGRNKKVTWAIASLANFYADHKVRNWQTEQIVVHDKVIDGMRVVYAGTTDLIIDIWDEKDEKWYTWLIDYKTSAAVYLSHKVQAMGYKEAAEQSKGIKIDKVGILLVGKQTEKGYQLAEVGKERVHPITFEDFVTTYKMALLFYGGKLPKPSYKTYPRKIQITGGIGDGNSTSDTANSVPGDRGSNTVRSSQQEAPESVQSVPAEKGSTSKKHTDRNISNKKTA